MHSIDREHQDSATTARKRSLAALSRRLQQSAATEQSREQQFREWQAQWESNKSDLIRRLDVIDQQLARLANDSRTPPQLTIVTDDEWS